MTKTPFQGMIFSKRLRFVISIVLCALICCSCTTTYVNHGYSFDDLGDSTSTISSITSGVTGEIPVLQLLGSPTFVSNFGPSTFFYVSNQFEHRSFLEPRLVKQRILEITFDDRHIVRSIKEYDLGHGKEVIYVKDFVHLQGNEMSVFEQFGRNFGRFNTTGQGPGGL